MANHDFNITPKAYLAELEAHDWYYEYSDDHRAYTKGRDNSKRLQAISEQSEELRSLYSRYVAFVNGKAEKPTITDETPATSTDAFTLNNVRKLASDGKIFKVEFIKRRTGELRRMRCRLGVKAHLKGGSKAYSPAAKQLLTVFDMDAKGYRSIPVEGIRSLKVGGQVFRA